MVARSYRETNACRQCHGGVSTPTGGQRSTVHAAFGLRGKHCQLTMQFPWRTALQHWLAPDGCGTDAHELFALPDGGGVAVAERSAVAVSVSSTVMSKVDAKLARIREARIKGYEGAACGECGNFTLVRNGTCLKCDTCGGTSGCS